MKILLAEDDSNLGKIISLMLKKYNFSVDWVQDGYSAYEAIYDNYYDVLVIDWLMPVLSGIDLCEKLRSEAYTGKILMLTAKNTITDKVTGLNKGADDYLCKPFEFEELIARIHALSRRTGIFLDDEVELAKFTLNRTTREISTPDTKLSLSYREFLLLDILIINKGQILTREQLLERIWGNQKNITTNNVDAYIKLLRKKFDLILLKNCIKTIRGIGYKFEE